MRTLLLITVITIISAVTISFSILNIQAKVISYPFTEEERVLIDRMLRISVYSDDLKNFALGCTEEDPSSSIPNECLAVINDWNTHADQLYEKHSLIIDKYAKAGAPTLKNFFRGCTEEVSAGHNPSSLILNECLSVVNDWNTHLDQLYDKHALIIDKYAKLNQTGVPPDPSA